MSELSRADAIQILEKLLNFEGIFEYIENHSVSVQDALSYAIDSLKTDEAYNLLHEKIDFIQIPDSGTNEDVLNDILRQAFPRVVFICSHDTLKKTQAMTIHMTDEWLEMPYERQSMNNVKTHNIKLQQEFAEAVLNGDKTFEVRYNDRGYQKGDRVQFKVMDGLFSLSHPLNGKTYEITYVLSGWGIKEDYVVFGIREIEQQA